MTQGLYCIKHEEMVVPEGACCIGHFGTNVVYGEFEEPQLDFCDFPDGYASCPPPEVELDWIEHAVEPESVYYNDEVDGLHYTTAGL